MEIEVGKRYRIDEEVAKSYSTPYYAIGIDNFYQAFPGMVVVVSSVQSNSRWVDTHSGYSLKVECLLPLLEEGMKVAVSTSCFGEDGDIDEDEYYETYPDGVGVIVELEDDGMHGVGGEGFFYIREKHLTPITDDVKTETKEKEMAESKLEKDIMLLKEAEKKWVGVVYDGKVDGGPKDCPCCEEYFEDDCDGCPIGNNCKGIGYSEWCEGTIEGPLLRKVNDAKSEALARDVLTKIGDIRRELEHELEQKREDDKDKREDDSLTNYEYYIDEKRTGVKVGERLRVSVAKNRKTIGSGYILDVDVEDGGVVITLPGFLCERNACLEKFFKRDDDKNIVVR